MENLEIIQDLAQKCTIFEPQINILNEELIDQYLFIIRALDYSLKTKLQNKKLLLPELRKHGNETIAIYSDYGGESSDSLYTTYSFLLCGWNHSYAFREGTRELRQKYQLNDKEISFKDLRYGPIRRSLDTYLKLLDNTVPGIVVSIVVDKKIRSFFGTKIPETILNELQERDLGGWKPRVTEKAMRIVHTIAYLVALLSEDQQKLYWVTDHDAVAGNENLHSKLTSLLQSVLSIYSSNSFPIIGYSTPFEKRNLNQLDFLSCADIAAGALEHYFTRTRKLKHQRIKPEADKILNWLGHDGVCLKKHTIIIEQNEDNELTVGEVSYISDEIKTERKIIPVRVKY